MPDLTELEQAGLVRDYVLATGYPEDDMFQFVLGADDRSEEEWTLDEEIAPRLALTLLAVDYVDTHLAELLASNQTPHELGAQWFSTL